MATRAKLSEKSSQDSEQHSRSGRSWFVMLGTAFSMLFVSLGIGKKLLGRGEPQNDSAARERSRRLIVSDLENSRALGPGNYSKATLPSPSAEMEAFLAQLKADAPVVRKLVSSRNKVTNFEITEGQLRAVSQTKTPIRLTDKTQRPIRFT